MAAIGSRRGNRDASPALAPPIETRRLSTTALVGRIAWRARLLAEQQVDLSAGAALPRRRARIVTPEPSR